METGHDSQRTELPRKEIAMQAVMAFLGPAALAFMQQRIPRQGPMTGNIFWLLKGSGG